MKTDDLSVSLSCPPRSLFVSYLPFPLSNSRIFSTPLFFYYSVSEFMCSSFSFSPLPHLLLFLLISIYQYHNYFLFFLSFPSSPHPLSLLSGGGGHFSVNLYLPLNLEYASGHCRFMAFTCYALAWTQPFSRAQKRLVVSKILCSVHFKCMLHSYCQ